MNVSIRPFRAPDAEAVSSLIRRTMLRSNARDYPPDVLDPLIAYFTPEKITALAAERHCLVAESIDGEVVGTAALEGNELLTFFVLPDRQGAGIGGALLESLEEEARRSGVERLHLASSLTAVGFYRSRGYVPTGRVIARDAGKQVEMEKILGRSPAA